MSNKTLKKQPEETESAPKVRSRNPRHLIFGILLLALGFFALYNGLSSLFDNTLRLLAPNGFITVEVVNTPETRQMGLSGRTSLSDREGMLFEFDSVDTENCFWMKDMQFSIDMVWMDDNREVVTVTSNVSPDTYPERFCPDKPAKYGLEIASGRAESLEITPGSKLRW
jgi:uncharacterized membrane protein (UPF0127 family)